MPIEFACESCSKLLRVPDGTSGSQCQCPACGVLLEIPDPNAVNMVEVVEGTSQADQLKIPCPKCNFELVSSRSLVGTKGQCKNCQYIFVISTDPKSPATESSEEDTGLTFTCPKCDQLFEGKEEMRGRKGKCHSCGEVFVIELKSNKGSPSPTQDQAEATLKISPAGKSNELDAFNKPTQPTLQKPKPTKPNPPQPILKPVSQLKPKSSTSPPTLAPQSPAPRTPEPPSPAPQIQAAPEQSIQIACSSCEGIMEVPASAAGQTTACPYCQQLLEIPTVAPASPAMPAADPLAASAGPWDSLGDIDTGLPKPQTPNPKPHIIIQVHQIDNYFKLELSKSVL